MKCGHCSEEHDEMYVGCPKCRCGIFRIFVKAGDGSVAPFCQECANNISVRTLMDIKNGDYDVLECRKCKSTFFEVLVTKHTRARNKDEVVVQCAKCKIIASDNGAYDKLYGKKK